MRILRPRKIDGKLTYCTSPIEYVGKRGCVHSLNQNDLIFLNKLNSFKKENELIDVVQDVNDDISQISLNGEQIKCVINDVYFKVDKGYELGYQTAEGLAEELVSELLDFTDIKHASYKSIFIKNDGLTQIGCKSPSFLKKNCMEMRVSTCLTDNNGIRKSEITQIFKHGTIDECLDITCKYTSKSLHIDYNQVKQYFLKIIAIDCITENIDRHFDNIIFIKNEDKTIEEGPIFDNGCALKSDPVAYKDLESFYNGKIGTSLFLKRFSFDEYADLVSRNHLVIEIDKKYKLYKEKSKLSHHKIYDDETFNRLTNLLNQNLIKYEKRGIIKWI